jgi:hypothetical protein
MNLVIISLAQGKSIDRRRIAENCFVELVEKFSGKPATVGTTQYFLVSTYELMRALSQVRPIEPEVSVRVFSLKAPSEQLVDGVTEENAKNPDSYLLNRAPVPPQ